jgi:hypothetical protein
VSASRLARTVSAEELTWFSGDHIEFSIVVELCIQDKSRIALLEAYSFTNNPHALLVRRELLASNCWLATIDADASWWIPDGQPRQLFRLSATVVQTIDSGERVSERPLIEFHRGTNTAVSVADYKSSPLPKLIENDGLAVVRVAAVPTIRANRLDSIMVRCNVELMKFTLSDLGSIQVHAPSRDMLEIMTYESIPIVSQLGLRGQTRSLGACSGVPVDFEVVGVFSNARRRLKTLYSWSNGKWEDHGVAQLVDAAKAEGK